MPLTVYTDADADLAHLSGITVAIVGYGNQGRAHALNLRDSGIPVMVAQRSGTPSYVRAKEDGFDPVSIRQAAASADLLALLLPDEVQPGVFQAEILPQLSRGGAGRSWPRYLLFAHGFNVRYGRIVPPEGVLAILVAPKGAGRLLRSEFLRGGGLACLVAIADGASREALNVALAYAKGIGGTKAGVLETTFAAETETDLFSEQVVLCGGVAELVKAAFETLVEAGYPEELAYFECLHELKLIADLYYQGGLAYMRKAISNTAEFGGYTRGPRIVTSETRAAMKEILAEIQSGKFAEEFLADYQAGFAYLLKTRDEESKHPIEPIGRELRKRMPWINE